MAGNTGWGGRIAASAMALCLAAGLSACQGGTHEASEGQDAPAAEKDYSAEFAEFEALIADLPDTYAYSWNERTEVDNGASAEEWVSAYDSVCDASGDAIREHVVFGSDDSFASESELFIGEEKAIRLDDGVPVDVSLDYQEAISEAALGESLEGELTEETLTSVTSDDDGLVYHFEISQPSQVPEGLGMLSAVDSATISMEFDKEGRLVRRDFEGRGEAQIEGQVVTAITKGVVTFSEWGTATVPEMPSSEATLTSNSLVDAQQLVGESLRALPDNMTCVNETEVTIAGGDSSMLHSEALRDSDRVFLYVEADGNEDEALQTFFDDGRMVMFQGDELLSDGDGALPEDSTGTEKAMSLIEAADGGYVYENNDGTVDCVFTLNGAHLPLGVTFDGVGSVEYITIHYWFDSEGVLESMGMTVEGATPADEGGEDVIVDSVTSYLDLNATEVPEMPAV